MVANKITAIKKRSRRRTASRTTGKPNREGEASRPPPKNRGRQRFEKTWKKRTSIPNGGLSGIGKSHLRKKNRASAAKVTDEIRAKWGRRTHATRGKKKRRRGDPKVHYRLFMKKGEKAKMTAKEERKLLLKSHKQVGAKAHPGTRGGGKDKDCKPQRRQE